MPEQNGPIARKTLTLFYVLDTSGSMVEAGKIGCLNEAMRETTDVLRDIAKKNADAEMKVAIMEFNSGCKWITEKPIYLEDFYWDDLSAGGLTDLGDALKELDTQMSKERFLSSDTGQYKPVIIFMSDGLPTDDWQKALMDVKTNNRWFQTATKIAFALGDADVKTLATVVGNPEAVIKTDDLEIFKRLIRLVSVASSLNNGTSRLDSDSKSSGQLVQEVLDDIGVEVQDATAADEVDVPDDFVDDGEEPDVEKTDDGWDDEEW